MKLLVSRWYSMYLRIAIYTTIKWTLQTIILNSVGPCNMSTALRCKMVDCHAHNQWYFGCQPTMYQKPTLMVSTIYLLLLLLAALTHWLANFWVTSIYLWVKYKWQMSYSAQLCNTNYSPFLSLWKLQDSEDFFLDVEWVLNCPNHARSVYKKDSYTGKTSA